MKKIFNKSFLILCLLLIIFWFIFSVIFINKVSFSVVTYQTKNRVQEKDVSVDLYKGKNFRGEFKARDNNLGLIIVKLDPRKVIVSNKDEIVIFKFRKKGKNNWEFERNYSMGLFDSQPSFSFGFPVINNSEGIKYEFEISSTTSDKGSYVRVKDKNVFITGYQYSKLEIMSGNLQTIRFIFNKTVGSFSDFNFVAQSAKNLTTLVSFLIILLAFKRFGFNIIYLKVLKYTLRVLKYININPNFFLLWKKLSIRHKINSNLLFSLSFALIIFWLLLIPFGFKSIQSQLNLLIYALLVIGAVKLFFEEANK